MDYSTLENSSLFQGIPAKDLRDDLEKIPHPIQCYEKGETVFHLMESAERIGIVLEGNVQAQKTFPNGSQVNVSVRGPGELIGPAAVFSSSRKYPCDVVAIDPATVMMPAGRCAGADAKGHPHPGESDDRNCFRHLHAAAASGAFLLQRHCAEGCVLAIDASKANREESDHNS